MPKRDFTIDDLDAEHRARRRRVEDAKDAFATTGIVRVDNRTYLLLHPSTRRPGSWQVSYFDQRGPSGHEEGRTRDEALERALQQYTLERVAVVTEDEFNTLAAQPAFIHGSKQVYFAQLDNSMRYEFGYGPETRRYSQAAYETDDIDEGIRILEDGLQTLRRTRTPIRR